MDGRLSGLDHVSETLSQMISWYTGRPSRAVKLGGVIRASRTVFGQFKQRARRQRGRLKAKATIFWRRGAHRLATYPAAWGGPQPLDRRGQSRYSTLPETCTTSAPLQLRLQLCETSLLPASLLLSKMGKKETSPAPPGQDCASLQVGKGSFGSPVAASCSLSVPWC